MLHRYGKFCLLIMISLMWYHYMWWSWQR